MVEKIGKNDEVDRLRGDEGLIQIFCQSRDVVALGDDDPRKIVLEKGEHLLLGPGNGDGDFYTANHKLEIPIVGIHRGDGAGDGFFVGYFEDKKAGFPARPVYIPAPVSEQPSL